MPIVRKIRIPLFDQSTPLAPVLPRIRERILAVVDSQHFVLGPEVAGFEEEFARYLGVPETVAVANGTDAITLALRALGVGPGDEVVVPSFTFYASAEAIPAAGATPVFCDVDATTGCVTADTVRAALTPRTKAVIAVDLFGGIAPIKEIAALGLPVIEDAAQAAGSAIADDRAGSFGNLGTFSFYPGKNLGCFGDGGAVATSDPELAERVRLLRFHGSRDKITYEHVGWNSRLDEIQAAVLRELLPHLDVWASGRQRAFEFYRRAGLGELVRLPGTIPETRAAWHLFVVYHDEADRLIDVLHSAGVEARPCYRRPIHRQAPMRALVGDVDLPVTDELARTNLAIPVNPMLSSEQAETVTAVIRAALA